MKKEIIDLIEISQYYGQKKMYVIAGGGNTSYKNDQHLWIKASGANLHDITDAGFCVMDRQKLAEIPEKKFSSQTQQREKEVKNMLMNSRANPDSGLRPSVETSLHNLFDYSYVVHTHATVVNGLMCSNNAAEKSAELWGDEVLYIPYTDPGYVLFMAVKKEVEKYKARHKVHPKVVMLQNHGVFVAANSIAEIKSLYAQIEESILAVLPAFEEEKNLPLSTRMTEVLPALRMLLSDNSLKVAHGFNTTRTAPFIHDKAAFESVVARPFTPDQIVYGLAEYLYIENKGTAASIIQEAREQIAGFKKRKGTVPKVIFIRNEGLVVADDSATAVEYLTDIVNDFCHIGQLTENFGGPHPLSPEQTAFIEDWEVENYRKKVARGAKGHGRLENKIVVITGAAQGFGAGIAEILHGQGANIIVADLNEEKGQAFTQQLNAKQQKNKVRFVATNVAESQSVKQLVEQTVLHFGGLDVMISNAGILRAGSLDEMDPATFELMTRVNYAGYFLCAKHAQTVMKIQHQINPSYFSDIIQINSKSGLKGSNKNFAYAGGKFGGIGLTQSFALELMPFNIKVNSICPGNFFDGPLWSDPENGLFVQYLNAGKVPGAKTIADVKSFYENQVPARRGCTAADVAKAIFYVIEQQYETGQAVPVTGGQEMLN